MRRSAPLARRTPLRNGAWLRRADPRTGFPPSVKRAVRLRSGLGDIHLAACEACGCWLGRYGGQVQHIRARGMGGSRLLDGITNAVLLCGTPQSGCHGACERRDARYRAMGFWLYSADEPQPVMLHGEQGGVTVWLTDDGRYVTERAA